MIVLKTPHVQLVKPSLLETVVPTGRCVQDLSGKRPRYAPEWTANLNVEYVYPLSRLGSSSLWDGLKLTTMVNVNFTDDFSVTSNAEPFLKQNAYAKVDVRIALGDSSNHWEIAFLGRNLSNQLTSNSGSSIAFLPGAFFELTERPRTLGCTSVVLVLTWKNQLSIEWC